MDEAFIQERIAQLRMKKGVSARDMSLSLGQSEGYINSIENKHSLPSISVFLHICEYLGITPMEFFDEGSQNPEKLKELLADLKRLDDKALLHIAGIARELVNRK
ncbi:MAG: helix-turn-helix domain-containing protein [Oscillospiraceae bacterium]|nr:helix-turn-helix domain-containing protein [Oscillospiraceae bacterium]